ncbi:MAG: phosphatase PAP2 family protein [Elusimicrobia bacterium]|nr:phosphatase PAP2 family protein [Elusimicrobiota bacterium]
MNTKKFLAAVTVIFILPVFVFSKDLTEEPANLQTDIGFGLFWVPAGLIAAGVVLRDVGKDSFFGKNTLQRRFSNGERHNNLDDYLQFAPLAGVVGLPLLTNIPHRSSYPRLLMLTAVSQVLSFGVVHGAKKLFDDTRPNASPDSFPSGHTAQAFMGAQILYLEYRDTNKWIAYAGYPVAAFVGADRVINNDHWVCDVLAGAGIGMAVPTLVYWADKEWFHDSDSKYAASKYTITPLYAENTYGLNLNIAF